MHKIILPGRVIWDWHPPVGEPRPLQNHPAFRSNSQTPSVKDLKSHRAINPKRGYHFFQAVIVPLSWKCLDCVSLLWLWHILSLYCKLVIFLQFISDDKEDRWNIVAASLVLMANFSPVLLLLHKWPSWRSMAIAIWVVCYLLRAHGTLPFTAPSLFCTWNDCAVMCLGFQYCAVWHRWRYSLPSPL